MNITKMTKSERGIYVEVEELVEAERPNFSSDYWDEPVRAPLPEKRIETSFCTLSPLGLPDYNRPLCWRIIGMVTRRWLELAPDGDIAAIFKAAAAKRADELMRCNFAILPKVVRKEPAHVVAAPVADPGYW